MPKGANLHDNLKSKISDRASEIGLTYSELASKTGIHPSQVSRICHGEFKTRSANVLKVCTELGIKVSVGGSEDAFSYPPGLKAAISTLSLEEIDHFILLLTAIRRLKSIVSTG